MHLRQGHAAASIANVADAVDRIEAELDRLEARANELKSAWDGEARDAFETAMREWDASVRSLRAVASAAARAASGSVARIGDFDRRRAGAWTR